VTFEYQYREPSTDRRRKNPSQRKVKTVNVDIPAGVDEGEHSYQPETVYICL
jgi:hypothetical protein